MKNLFKSVMLGIGFLAAGLLNSNAVIVSYSVPTNGYNIYNLYDGPARVNTVTVTSPTGNPTLLTFCLKDAPLTNTAQLYLSGDSYIGRQWTNTINTTFTYLTNLTKIVTNFTGITYTNTYTNVVWTGQTTAGGFTNAWDVKAQTVVATNGGTYTVDFGGSVFTFGISVTNNPLTSSSASTYTVVVDYDPLP